MTPVQSSALVEKNKENMEKVKENIRAEAKVGGGHLAVLVTLIIQHCNHVQFHSPPRPPSSFVTHETTRDSLQCGQKLLLCESIFLTGLYKQGEPTGTPCTPHRSAPNPLLARLTQEGLCLIGELGPDSLVVRHPVAQSLA